MVSLLKVLSVPHCLCWPSKHLFTKQSQTSILNIFLSLWLKMTFKGGLQSFACLVARLVKNSPAVPETPWFDSWVRKIPWRKDRLSNGSGSLRLSNICTLLNFSLIFSC